MLCQAIKNRSIWIWNTLIKADELACRVGEESITDFLILELAKRSVSGSYSVKAFTKPQEHLNGADWEMWLTGPSGNWIGFRIQAKVIDISTLSYKQLHHGSARAETQAQRLIADAAAVSAIPIYVLYSAWHENSKSPKWKCKSHSYSKKTWGLSMISANHVKMISPAKTLASLSPYMLPLHSLFCCEGFDGDDLPTKLKWLSEQKILTQANLLKAPPSHVQLLLQQPNKKETAGINIPYGLGRIVVLEQKNT